MNIPDTKEERSHLYSEYLRSLGWVRISNLRKNKDHNHCCLCGSDANLVVHHLSYKNIDRNNPGSEDIHDLITLCNDCHKRFHAAKDELDMFYKTIEEKFILECKLKLEQEFESLFNVFLTKAIEVNKKYENRKIPEAEYCAKSKLRENLISCLTDTLNSSISNICLPRVDTGKTFKIQEPVINENESHKKYIISRIQELK